jgi:hypothetical protein
VAALGEFAVKREALLEALRHQVIVLWIHRCVVCQLTSRAGTVLAATHPPFVVRFTGRLFAKEADCLNSHATTGGGCRCVRW